MVLDLHSDPKVKLSLSAGYSGVTLSFSIKPEKLRGAEELDYEMRFDVYTRKFGFETELSHLKTLDGTFQMVSPLLVPEIGDSVLLIDLPEGYAPKQTYSSADTMSSTTAASPIPPPSPKATSRNAVPVASLPAPIWALAYSMRATPSTTKPSFSV